MMRFYVLNKNKSSAISGIQNYEYYFEAMVENYEVSTRAELPLIFY